MVDSPEELEPLFTYSRVQPFCIVSVDDYDSEASPSQAPKRRKGEKLENDDDEEIKVVENWLPSPPKVDVDSGNSVGQDSIIKQLRLKKQELESLAKSAGDVLRAVEESAITEECQMKSQEKILERPKIVISIQDKNGAQLFRVFKDDTLEKIFRCYAEKLKCDLQDLVFCFDGDKINPTASPESLGMEDDDIIEAHLKKH